MPGNSPVARLRRAWEKKVAQRDERDSVRFSDLCILLTARDSKRLQELYGGLPDTIRIPICLPEPENELRPGDPGTVHLFFLGSLWYESNVKAVEWFLDYVWQPLQKAIPGTVFTVAGSRPSEDLRCRLSRETGVVLIPDFDSPSSILERGGVFVAPILVGAGMKVKVAEALSYGLPVAGSSEALEGYGELLSDPLSEGVVARADRPQDYLEFIRRVAGADPELIRSRAFTLYKKYYSYARCVEELGRVLLPGGEQS